MLARLKNLQIGFTRLLKPLLTGLPDDIMGKLKPADDGLTQQFAIWRDIVGGVSTCLVGLTNE